MKRLSATAIAVLLSCGAAVAQTPLGSSALGPTSPLGIPGASASAGPSGIGLGATEITIGGLSPAVSPACSAVSSVRALTAASTFDGGGMATAASGCTGASVGAASSGDVTSPPSSGTSLSGGSIPLGATEVDSSGLSPLITVSPFGATLGGCPANSGTSMTSPNSGGC